LGFFLGVDDKYKHIEEKLPTLAALWYRISCLKKAWRWMASRTLSK
jgi:hypothetical protein